MSLRRLKQTLLITSIVFAAGATLALQHGFAATGQVYISPATSSVQNGNNITLSIRINPGANIDCVTTVTSYDQSALQYVSADASGNSFPTQAQQTYGGGVVHSDYCNTGGGVASDSLIVRLTFKALAGSGSTNLSVSGQASNYGAGTPTNPASGNATVNLTSPAPPPSPAPSPSPSPTPSPTPSPSPSSTSSPSHNSTGSSTSSSKATTPAASPANPTPTPTTTPQPGKPIVGTRSQAQFTEASITSTSNVPVQVYIKYGVAKNKLDGLTQPSDFSTSHTIELNPQLIVPGTTYYYVVVSKDQQGNTVESTVQTLKTKGYSVRITLLDEANQPLKSKVVTLHSTPVTVKTNNKGIATFEGVAPGLHQIEYTTSSHKYSKGLYVENNVVTKSGVQIATPQNMAIVYSGLVQKGFPWAVVWMGLTVLILVGAFFIVRTGMLTSALALLNKPTPPRAINGDHNVQMPSSSGTEQPQGGARPTAPAVERLVGLQKPDPGTVITPNESKDEEHH